MHSNIFTVRETGEYLNMGKGTIKKMIVQKRLPFPHFKIGTSIRIRKSDVDKYIEDNSIDFTKPKSNKRGPKPKVPDLAKETNN